MKSRFMRWFAAATSVLLVGASVGVATAASADPLPTISVTPDNATPGMFDDIVFTATISGYDSTCVDSPPTVSWTNTSMESGLFTSGSLVGDVLTVTYTWPAIGNGQTRDFTAQATGGCLGSSLISDTTSVQNVFTQFYAYGKALRAFAPVSFQNTTGVPGVVVDLINVEDGPTGVPESTTTTDADGNYTIYAPLDSYADMEERYKIRFTYPNGELTTYYDPNASASTTSNATWESTPAKGPCGTGDDCFLNLQYFAFIGVPYEFEGDDTIGGIAYDQVVPEGTSIDDYERRQGVEVDLLDFGGGESNEPYDSDITDADGEYELTAPVGSEEDALREYVIRFTYPDDSVRYYDVDGDLDSPSETSFEEASPISPSSWDASENYNAFNGVVPEPSESDWNLVCEEDGGEATDFETNTVFWEELCRTGATVNEAGTFPNDRGDALDGFGQLRFYAAPDGEDSYWPTADSFSTDENNGAATYVFVDEDVWVYDSDGALVNVDIRVHRLLAGSWMKWSIDVFEAGTTTAATNVPFTFEGSLGSDDETLWIGTGPYRVSHDNNDDGDPIVIHSTNASEWETESGDNDSKVYFEGSGFSYTLGILDYEGCIGVATLGEAVSIAANLPTTAGTAIAPLTGGECDTEPVWEPTLGDLEVGVPVDVTFTVPDGLGFDWSEGGYIEVFGDLPAGLEEELIDEWVEDTAPSVRIFGTPLIAGDYEFGMEASDDFDTTAERMLTGYVWAAGSEGPEDPEGPGDPEDPETPQMDASLTLGIEIGDEVAGAPVNVTATGLMEEANYLLVVRSEPQVLASGNVPVGGELLLNTTIPAGLEPGWHSLTLTSRWFDGSSLLEVLWFFIGQDGSLVATSTTERTAATTAGLAYTGVTVDASGFLMLAAAMSLAGVALARSQRRRGAGVESA